MEKTLLKEQGGYPMPRVRTLKKAYEELQTQDSSTCVSRYCFERLVKSGMIPSFKAGRKYLVNMSEVEDYFSNPNRQELEQLEAYKRAGGFIRPVKE